jgi:hypothetical protein
MGADIARQCMRKGLLEELHIHLVPVLLVPGIRLFEHLGHDLIELERTSVIPTPAVTHLTFRARGKASRSSSMIRPRSGLWALIGGGCCGTSRNPPTSSPQWQASSPSTRSVRSLEVAF